MVQRWLLPGFFTLLVCSCDSGGETSGSGGLSTTSSSSGGGGVGGTSTGTAGSTQTGTGTGGGTGGVTSSGTGADTGTGGVQSNGFSLRFFGNGVQDIDRVKIQVDKLPPDNTPGPPVDVGATDFTIEFWMRAAAGDNTAAPVDCGANVAWINGNIVVDRDRYNQDRKWGLSIAGGKFVFGVSGNGTGDRTICGGTPVLDNTWHHVAIERRLSDGRLWIFVDGQLDATNIGPEGDVSYPDNGVPGDYCGGPCNSSDPFLVLAAEKHDAGPAYPSYSGYLDEMRVSKVLRYMTSFDLPNSPYVTDADTVALYHFDEGAGVVAADSSGAPGGPSDGVLSVGGTPQGPIWTGETPF
ncbi:MAG: LamG domain-containing protein [Polyangiaceae bacterium]|nr:LamG domain-containing protein [Polyangiaceae bacterium]